MDSIKNTYGPGVLIANWYEDRVRSTSAPPGQSSTEESRRKSSTDSSRKVRFCDCQPKSRPPPSGGALAEALSAGRFDTKPTSTFLPLSRWSSQAGRCNGKAECGRDDGMSSSHRRLPECENPDQFDVDESDNNPTNWGLLKEKKWSWAIDRAEPWTNCARTIYQTDFMHPHNSRLKTASRYIG